MSMTKIGKAGKELIKSFPELDLRKMFQKVEPEKIDGRTKRVEGKTVPKSDNIIDAEEITDSKNLNNLKKLGKVIGAGAVGTGIYKATSDENKKNEKDEKNEKDTEHKDLDLSNDVVVKPVDRSSKASNKDTKNNKKEFTRKPFTGKLEEYTDLGESEEAKFLTARINKTLDNISKLKDPPMTAVKLRADMFEQLKKDRDNRERSLEWAKLGDRFLAAITKYAAAKEGLARGLDMSNVNIKGSDWDKAIDRAYAKYTEAVKETQDRFDKQDKAKSAVDKSRQELGEKLMDMRTNLKKLQDVRAKENARMREKRRERYEDARADHEKQQDLMQRHYENLEYKKEAEKEREAGKDRRAAKSADSKVQAAKIKAESPSGQDKILSQIINAALIGENTLKKTLNSARVLSKMDKEFLEPYMKDPWLGSKKVDVKRLREDLLKIAEEREASRPETKTVGGKTYIKVPGGWKEQ